MYNHNQIYYEHTSMCNSTADTLFIQNRKEKSYFSAMKNAQWDGILRLAAAECELRRVFHQRTSSVIKKKVVSGQNSGLSGVKFRKQTKKRLSGVTAAQTHLISSLWVTLHFHFAFWNKTLETAVIDRVDLSPVECFLEVSFFFQMNEIIKV